MIRNINEQFGDPVDFENVEEMEQAILACGYELPEDGLQEDRDFIDLSDNPITDGDDFERADKRGDEFFLIDQQGRKQKTRVTWLLLASADRNDGKVTLETTTARRLLDNLYGLAPETITPDDKDDVTWIESLADKHGWDTMLFRADDIAEGEYTPKAISKHEALLAYVTHDGQRLVSVRVG